MFDAVALADLFGHEALLAGVASDGHPASAYATDHQALQQRWVPTRRALAAVGSNRLRIFPKTAEVLLILLPRDVTGTSIF